MPHIAGGGLGTRDAAAHCIMTYPAPEYRSQWDRRDYRVPKKGIPWYVVLLGITAIALVVLTVVGFWIASSSVP
jgi:hypothetical protein